MSNRTGVIILSRKYADKDGIDECLTFSENNTFAELRERLAVRYNDDGTMREDKLSEVPNYILKRPFSGIYPKRDLVYAAVMMEYALRNFHKNHLA